MIRIAAILGLLLPITSLDFECAGQDIDAKGATIHVSVYYETQILILSKGEEVAEIIFFAPASPNEVRFRFRVLGKDGSIAAGKATLRVKSDGTNRGPGHASIRAGDFDIKWTAFDKERGYVYYNPDVLRLHYVTRYIREEDGQVVEADLKRFKWTRSEDQKK